MYFRFVASSPGFFLLGLLKKGQMSSGEIERLFLGEGGYVGIVQLLWRGLLPMATFVFGLTVPYS